MWLVYCTQACTQLPRTRHNFAIIWCHSSAYPTSPSPSSQLQVLAAITTPKRLKHAFQDQRIMLNRGKPNPPAHSELVTSGTGIGNTTEGIDQITLTLARRRRTNPRARVEETPPYFCILHLTSRPRGLFHKLDDLFCWCCAKRAITTALVRIVPEICKHA